MELPEAHKCPQEFLARTETEPAHPSITALMQSVVERGLRQAAPGLIEASPTPPHVQIDEAAACLGRRPGVHARGDRYTTRRAATEHAASKRKPS